MTYGTAMRSRERKSDFKLTKDTSYLARQGEVGCVFCEIWGVFCEIWGVYYENFEEHRPGYKGITLYVVYRNSPNGIPHEIEHF